MLISPVYLLIIIFLLIIYFINRQLIINLPIKNIYYINNFQEFNQTNHYYPCIILNELDKSQILFWKFDFFQKNYGEQIVKVTQPFVYSNTYKPVYKYIKFKNYINLLEKKSTYFYLKYEDNNQFFKEINLQDDINKFFKEITPKISIKKTSFWMGPKNSKTPLHYDTDYINLLSLISGKKEIYLIHPKYTKYLYQSNKHHQGSNWSNIDIWNIDYNKYPLAKHIQYTKIILKPGQILNIPPFYWHAVKNIDNSIAFTYHYYSLSSILMIDIPDTILYILNKIFKQLLK